MEHENVYLKKISDKKYELITKNFDLHPRVYRLYNADGVIILKPEYSASYKKKEQIEDEKENTKKTYNSYEANTNNYTANYVKKEYLPESTIFKNPYYVCEDSEEARTISRSLYRQITEGIVLGIKGFDGKYYVFKKEYYHKVRDSILECAKNSDEVITLAKLQVSTKEPEDALKGTLEIMKEEGYLFEKTKGNYHILK